MVKDFDFRKYSTLLLVGSLFLPVLFAGKFVIVDARQEQDKAVNKMSFPKEPVEVTDLKASGKSIKVGEKFKGGEEWLEGLTFKLKNNNKKPIIYASMYLEFPETQATGTIMSYPIEFGQRPGRRNTEGEPAFVVTGGGKAITLSGSEYAKVKEFIESRQPISSISKVTVSVPLIYFADGTAWVAGKFFQPDPSAPRKMRPVDAP